MPTASPPSPRQVLRVDMGAHKQALKTLAAARGVTVSALARSLLLEALRPLGEASPPQPSARRGAASPAVRLNLQIDPEVAAAVTRRADAEGMSTRAYVGRLLHAHVDQAPQFGAHELRALGESNGRLLDLVQQLRRDGPQAAECLARIEPAVRAHLAEVRELIIRNEKRWRQ